MTFSLYGLFVFYEGQVLSVTLAIFLYLVTLLFLFSAFEKESIFLFFASGVSLGISGITMSGIFLFVPFVIFCTWHFFRKRITWILLSAFFMLGVLLPISLTTLHNYKAEKDFVPVTAHGGITFYTGNNPDAKAYFQPVKGIDAFDIRSFAEGARGIAEKNMGRKLRPSEISSY